MGESISSLNNLKCSIYYGDVTKADTLNSIFDGCDGAEIFVIHCAAVVSEIVNGRLPTCVKGGYDFVDVRDVAKGIIMACDKGKMGECYIMSGEFVSIKKLADLVCDVVGKKRIKVVLPIMIAKIVASFYEIYYNLKGKTPLFTKYSLYTLSSNSNFSNEKAKRDLGFVTRDITDTVRDMVMWILGDFKE